MAQPIMSGLGDLFTSTLIYRRKNGTLADLITKHSPTMMKLSRKGRLVGGGTQISEQLMVALNPSFQYARDYDRLRMPAQSVISQVVYDWAESFVVIQMSNSEKLKNAGRQRFLNIAKIRFNNMMTSFHEYHNRDIFLTGAAHQGKGIEGFQHVISDSGMGTVGGIDAAQYSLWRNIVWNVSDDGESLNPATVKRYFGRSITALIRGKDRPDLIIVPNEIWDEFDRSMQGIQRQSSTEMANLGFQSLKVKGIPVVHDQYCPANRAYVITSKYLKLVQHRNQRYKRIGGERMPVDQNASVEVFGHACQLVPSARNRQGVIVFD